VPVIIEPDGKNITILLVLEDLLRYWTLSVGIEVVTQELKQAVSQDQEPKKRQQTFNHLNTISTSLSLSGFISLDASLSGGINNPSTIFRISFQTLVITISLAVSLRYVLRVWRFASK
jgi:hypothetical protein